MDSIAVMQPYLFPYIGYFQLVRAVNQFVFYDDVDFIKNGWINRNKILINGKAKYFTIPCSGASPNKKIEVVEHGLDKWVIKKLLKKIKFAYSRALYFDEVYDLVERVLKLETGYISDLAMESVRESSVYLGLTCTFKKSSSSYDNEALGAADRLIDICNMEGYNNYINLTGGQRLYDKEYFKERGINLYFIQSQPVEYEQFGDEFVPWLSIIDVMMFNPPEKIKNDLLNSYKLI